MTQLSQDCQLNRAALIQAGAVPALSTMLPSDNLGVVQSAAACIAQLARGSHHEREAIIASGALPVLAALSSSDKFRSAGGGSSSSELVSLSSRLAPFPVTDEGVVSFVAKGMCVVTCLTQVLL